VAVGVCGFVPCGVGTRRTGNNEEQQRAHDRGGGGGGLQLGVVGTDVPLTARPSRGGSRALKVKKGRLGRTPVVDLFVF
jgi:hypothetical protein